MSARLGAVALLGLACSADHLAEQGQAALDRHHLPAAEESFRRALSKEPRHLGALAGLGWTYQLAGERAAAFGAFERCGQVAPEHAECQRGLASVALSGGEPMKARGLLARTMARACS